MPSTLREAADEILSATEHGSLAAFIAARRPVASWRRIALDLRDATGGRIDVTDHTVRNWAQTPHVP